MLQKRAKQIAVCTVIPVVAFALFALMYVFSLTPAHAQARRLPTEGKEKTPSDRPIKCFASIRNALDKPIPGRVRLFSSGLESPLSIELPEGEGEFDAPAGAYTAGLYAYEKGVPILVHVEPLTLSTGARGELKTVVIEGSGGNRPLRAFDRDGDLALDRAELEAGTDPGDARSVPFEQVRDWPSPVLDKRGAWYRGDLHVHSAYGSGSEKVGELIRRAESDGLDFLAIADPNTLAAAEDPAFSSKKVVLIPALEWQHPTLGTALLYAPSSPVPFDLPIPETQALAEKVQAQGGIFAIAHPTQPGQIWQWGLDHYTAIEGWFGRWRGTPPIEVGNLNEELGRRNKKNNYVHPIAYAAATRFISANAQAAVFYDVETTHGNRVALIGGSGSNGKKQPLGQPMTYVWAKEKSLNGILDGLRRGRTFVSAGPNAPFVEFSADIMADGSTDVGPGGIIPINVKSKLSVGVEGAKGARLEILFNGYPVRTITIKWDRFVFSVDDKPGATGAYRARVVTETKGEGYGVSEVLAMSSPIYALSYYVDPKKGESTDGWVDIASQWQDSTTVKIFDPNALDPSQVITLDAPQKK